MTEFKQTEDILLMKKIDENVLDLKNRLQKVIKELENMRQGLLTEDEDLK